ncbi:MAG: DUF554 domain-containing protein [Paludibacteraceae bacterium]|nr:DUF554 domain-containing protein [Paludibacteraceae bacterium]MBN2788339.1 DUF554 domain-containing protein [Paludibacteraceae bacterium]
MTGTLINTGAVILGSSIGLLLKQNLPEKYKQVFFQVVGLFTMLLGISMAIKLESPLLVVFSLILGGFVGEWLNLDNKSQSLGNRLKKRFKLKNEKFTEGFVTGFLLFCMGSMSILGAIEEGFGKTSDILLIKSLMDGFSSVILASTLGIGVLFSSLTVLLFQGGITLLVMLLGKDIPAEIISGITTVGGIILLALGFHLLEIKRFKVINLLPSLFFICLFVWLKLHFSF